MRLKDKVCIVTGGTRGIGFSVVESYLQEGAKVCICGSSDTSANKAYEQLIAQGYNPEQFMAKGMNLDDIEHINQVFSEVKDKFGKIDVLVNNAGITTSQSILDTSIDSFKHELNINLVGVFACIKAVIPYMIDNGGGSIINTSSLVARYGSINQPGYVASKFGVNGLTIEASRELGKYNIRVNAVSPGVVKTDMVKENVTEEMLAYLNNLTPLQRMGNPYELAGAYVYLASDESSYTTGTNIDVNGGIIK